MQNQRSGLQESATKRLCSAGVGRGRVWSEGASRKSEQRKDIIKQ